MVMYKLMPTCIIFYPVPVEIRYEFFTLHVIHHILDRSIWSTKKTFSHLKSFLRFFPISLGIVLETFIVAFVKFSCVFPSHCVPILIIFHVFIKYFYFAAYYVFI